MIKPQSDPVGYKGGQRSLLKCPVCGEMVKNMGGHSAKHRVRGVVGSAGSIRAKSGYKSVGRLSSHDAL